jgi:hypothetical protein
MEQQLAQDDPAPSGVKSWQLWYSLASGVIVWSIHLLIIYALTSLACEWEWFSLTAAGLNGLQIIQLIVTVIAGAAVWLGGFFALRNRQRLGNGAAPDENRHRFMVYLGLALSILFFALVTFPIITILVLPPCG